MSDLEEDNFCFYGKPLEPYDEDTFPKKKPIQVEDQIATDAQGRRRFHGAFQGGFSAGFYNTVGSLEGWTPSEFKSTRADKAKNKTQKPEDFMDDEDIGQFGIAPQTVRATKDYSTSKKRSRQAYSDGPIPGEPVLHSLLSSGNETIGYILLKNIGLKTKPQDEAESDNKIYGCVMPKTYEIARNDDLNQYEIDAIYTEFLASPKDNSFGLGYTSLNKTHGNLFTSSKLVIREQNKKNISITGQAFGVGAFEDDDDDIYVKDDMTKYDFEMTTEKTTVKNQPNQKDTIFGEFTMAKDNFRANDVFLPPTIPQSFSGKHKVRRSRFAPLAQPPEPERRDVNAEVRALALGEEVVTTPTPSGPVKIEIKEENKVEVEPKKPFDLLSSVLGFDRFIAASSTETTDILEVVEKSQTEHGTEEMRGAAKMKMFGPLTRVTEDWQPCSLLCRRFNVPEPNTGLDPSKNKKRTKNLIFEYEQFSDVPWDLKAGINKKPEDPNTEKGEEKQEPTETIEMETSTTSEDTRLQSVEKPIDITDKIDVDKNIDLFKAVFLASDESESEEELEVDKNEEMKHNVLSDNLLPTIIPMKEGILSNVDFSLIARQPEERPPIEVIEINDDCYGPSLPKTIAKPIIPVRVNYNNDGMDEWVEKPKKDKKNKSEHKKKHKEKKSVKKHKHHKKDR